MLSIENAFEKMKKKNPAWAGLTMVRHDLVMVKGTLSDEKWTFKSGRKPEPKIGQVYLPVLKKATIQTDGEEYAASAPPGPHPLRNASNLALTRLHLVASQANCPS